MAFNTDTLEYDINKHKYYITSNGFKDRYAIDLQEELGQNNVSGITEEEVFINQVTDNVYRWLYWYIRPENVRITEKRIADNFEAEDYGIPYREAIEEALYETAASMIRLDIDLEAIDNGDMNALIPITARMVLKSSGMATKKRMGVRVYDNEWRVGY